MTDVGGLTHAFIKAQCAGFWCKSSRNENVTNASSMHLVMAACKE